MNEDLQKVMDALNLATKQLDEWWDKQLYTKETENQYLSARNHIGSTKCNILQFSYNVKQPIHY